MGERGVINFTDGKGNLETGFPMSRTAQIVARRQQFGNKKKDPYAEVFEDEREYAIPVSFTKPEKIQKTEVENFVLVPETPVAPQPVVEQPEVTEIAKSETEEDRKLSWEKNAGRVVNKALEEALEARVKAQGIVGAIPKGDRSKDKSGLELRQADKNRIASLAGKEIREIILRRRNVGDEIELTASEQEKIAETIKNANIHSLIFRTFVLNAIDREIALAKKANENGEFYHHKFNQPNAETAQRLMEKIFRESELLRGIEASFLRVRKDKTTQQYSLKFPEIENIKKEAHLAVMHELVSDGPISISVKGESKEESLIKPEPVKTIFVSNLNKFERGAETQSERIGKVFADVFDKDLSKYGRKGHGRYLEMGNWDTGAITKLRNEFVSKFETESENLSAEELIEKIKEYAIANVARFTDKPNIVNAVRFVCGVEAQTEKEPEPAKQVKVESKGEIKTEEWKQMQPVHVAVTATTETEKKPLFEIPTQERLAFEDNLIFAFQAIEEIVGEDLEIDFIPAEKRTDGDVRAEIADLLNGSAHVDSEKATDEERKKYWQELQRLHRLGTEILELEKQGKLCVIYAGQTFFIDKKHEIPQEDLKQETESVVGEGYLEAFMFGVRTDFEEYLRILNSNDNWKALSESKQEEKLKEAVVFYANRILDENSKTTDAKSREKVYRYAFSILNKQKNG